jgi:peptidoglycan LD-endopeptidase LytH
MALKPETKKAGRIFALGAACGFVAGAFIVAAIVWRDIGIVRPAQPAVAVDARDGGASADVDVPVLQQAPPPEPANGIEAAPAEAPAIMRAAPPAALTGRRLEIPVEGVQPEQLSRSFDQRRDGTRPHEAIDILAPRNTPVKAVEDGTIARLFLSKAGGITIYQFDPTEQFCYYYAHLERYADGLREGDNVKKGQILGYVGTSGNAPKNTPHLHFAVFKLNAEKHWWEGTPIDPYDILR